MKNHVLIISGGVSVGEHDLVQEALREVGAKIEIWRVAVKPGKAIFVWTSRTGHTLTSILFLKEGEADAKRR